MKHPVIGITGRRSGAPDGYPETLSHLSSDVFVTAYAEAVVRAGGLPVWLSREADPIAVAASLDGLLIAGGQDVDPRRYGAVPTATSTALDPARDQFEIDVVHAAVALERPVLGICRGLQLINVAFGGTLQPDLAAGTGESHAFLGYPAWHRSHPVELLPGSRLAAMLGSAISVNSYHHQCVGRLGGELVAVAFAPDGVVEALELPGASLLAVQWHPEMLREPDPVFDWLVNSCYNLEDSETQHALA